MSARPKAAGRRGCAGVAQSSRVGGLRLLGRLAAKAERAGERAESDERKANAVATVIGTLDSALIQLSSMIIVKFDGRIICRVLTEVEVRLLGAHPELLKAPGDLIGMIDRSRHDESRCDDRKAAPPVIGL